MPAGGLTTGVVDVDDLGSHFVLAAQPGAVLTAELERLPHAVSGESGWVAPAIPVVAVRLRRLLVGHPGVSVRPRAEKLLGSVEKLPVTATAVAHLCEHRPGRLGVVIVTTGDPLVDAALAGVPDRRHDAVLGRWWIPAVEEPLRALREVMNRVRGLTATLEVRRRIERFEQPSLNVAAVAGLEHRCHVAVGDASGGEARVRVCRRCNPELEPTLRARDIAVARSSDSWWLTIDGGGRVLSLLVEQPDLLAGADVRSEVEVATTKARAVEEMEELSTGTVGQTAVEGVAATLRPFHGAAVQYALRARRTFLADEPGLGKTLQALASVEAAGAFPALIVCPASLRLNWLREAGQWLPDRSARAVDPDRPVLDADVHVVAMTCCTGSSSPCRAVRRGRWSLTRRTSARTRPRVGLGPHWRSRARWMRRRSCSS
ncbi:MAG: SNF2-related protein [Solirubrobacteraceae bacterium]